MKNNIKELLKAKDMSILKLSEITGLTYSNTHALVNRKDLGTTSLDTLSKVADALNVNVSNLYKEEK